MTTVWIQMERDEKVIYKNWVTVWTLKRKINEHGFLNIIISTITEAEYKKWGKLVHFYTVYNAQNLFCKVQIHNIWAWITLKKKKKRNLSYFK